MARRKKGNPVHGWMVIDKPAGLTSAQIVGKVRWLLNARKVGHGGTLDPLATGILPLAFGEATKTVSYAMDGRKSYSFSVRWGQETESCDSEGRVIRTTDHRPDDESIRAVLDDFLGTIEQMPPRFSALKIGGRRACDLARNNQDFQLTARPVVIDKLALVGLDGPDIAHFTVDCGKGTYVRSLARDLGYRLGTLAHIVALRRTRVGPFDLSQAISLESLEKIGHNPADGVQFHQFLHPVTAALDDIPVLALSETEARDLRFGRRVLPGSARIEAICTDTGDGQIVLATQNTQAVALCRFDDPVLRPVRVLNL